MIYPKINTIWKRDPERKFQIIQGVYACEEFSAIKSWSITEKIDGMNIRVYYRKDADEMSSVEFFGKTDNAQIPIPLGETLRKLFHVKDLTSHFDKHNVNEAILYGEGYGAKIQKGGGSYRKDQGFILFSALIGGLWCDRHIVKQLAVDLKIDSVPVIAEFTTVKNAQRYVKAEIDSLLAKAAQKNIEGVVATSEPLMLFKNGNPIMWKLKCKDFQV